MKNLKIIVVWVVIKTKMINAKLYKKKVTKNN